MRRRAIFEACIAAAARAGAAIAAIPVADTLKRVADNERAIVATISRAGLWQAQTPQAFRRDLLVTAHRRALDEGIVATDDADLVERTGARVEVVEASTANIKITTPSDLALAEALIAAGNKRGVTPCLLRVILSEAKNPGSHRTNVRDRCYRRHARVL